MVKKVFAFVGIAVSFISGIITIAISLHFGNIFLPNPIIVIVSIIVSIFGWYCAFQIGRLYGPYSLFTSIPLFKRARKAYPFRKYLFSYCRERFIHRHGKRKKEPELVQRLYELKTKGLYEAKTKEKDYVSLFFEGKKREHLNIQIIPELKVTRGEKITRERYDAKQ